MEDERYLGYASESDYHAHHTLLAMLECEQDQAERAEISQMIEEIEARADKGAGCCTCTDRSALLS